MLMAEVCGGRVRGRPRISWMNGVKVALSSRGMTVEAARQGPKDKEWRYWCIAVDRVSLDYFCLVPVFFPTAIPRSCGLLPGEGWYTVI